MRKQTNNKVKWQKKKFAFCRDNTPDGLNWDRHYRTTVSTDRLLYQATMWCYYICCRSLQVKPGFVSVMLQPPQVSLGEINEVE